MTVRSLRRIQVPIPTVTTGDISPMGFRFFTMLGIDDQYQRF